MTTFLYQLVFLIVGQEAETSAYFDLMSLYHWSTKKGIFYHKIMKENSR